MELAADLATLLAPFLDLGGGRSATSGSGGGATVGAAGMGTGGSGVGGGVGPVGNGGGGGGDLVERLSRLQKGA